MHVYWRLHIDNLSVASNEHHHFNYPLFNGYYVDVLIHHARTYPLNLALMKQATSCQEHLHQIDKKLNLLYL